MRLDSGDFAYLSKKVRNILNENGLYYVKIVVSNQLDEYTIQSLNNQNISILEPSEIEEWERREREKTSILDTEVSLPLDDPVKMYLKQMGQIPLLSREDEIRLAKDIEEKEFALREVVFKTPLAKQEFLSLLKQSSHTASYLFPMHLCQLSAQLPCQYISSQVFTMSPQ